MVDINKINSSVLLHQQPKTPHSSDIETAKPTPMVVSHHQLLDIMDDMSMAMSQFNRRQDLQKKQQDSSEINSRILEDNADRKLATVIKLLHNQKNKLAQHISASTMQKSLLGLSVTNASTSSALNLHATDLEVDVIKRLVI
ncbi:MAG: hypothetical protein ACL7AX_00730 [Candidatus Arsenophonus phytopathogenicus]